MSRVSFIAEGRIGYLTLRRPEKLNALDAAMVDELLLTARQIDRRDDIDVVILSGEGKAFCAGGDITAWSDEPAETFGRRWVRDGHDAFDALARLRQPLIAVLDGHALGGGLELAATADLRIAEAHIKIGFPETSLGIIPGWSGSQRAVRRFGAQVVRRMAVMGEVFEAVEAKAEGVVDHVVPSGQAMEKAREMAEVVLARSPSATALTKMLLAVAEGEEVERVVESLAGTVAASSADLQEGIVAFKEKRKPIFRK